MFMELSLGKEIEEEEEKKEPLDFSVIKLKVEEKKLSFTHFVGQYASLGPVAAYKRFCPLLRGLGYGMVLVSSVVMLYYNLIIAWTLYYMFASVAGEIISRFLLS